MMQCDNHHGKSWNDLHLNDMICAQTQAWANKQESTDLPEWMREMCRRGSDPEVKMMTGERAFQFGRLVALEMWREVMKERRLDQLMDKLVEFEELKVGMWELMEMNLDLVRRVSRLEEVREKRRVARKECQWCPSLVRPKRKQALQFAGGDGSEEKPYVELGLLAKGVLVEEGPVASGSGVGDGDRTPVMVTAPSTPLLASLEELD